MIPRAKPVGYKVKVIVSGHVTEVYRYEDTVWRNLDASKNSPSTKILSIDDLEENLLDVKLESRGKSNIRARNTIRRLALANFSHKSKFLTLTFKEHITDLTEANREFKRFIKNLRYNLGSFKYLAVIEFTKAGRIHYHVLLDIKYISAKKIEAWWGNGFIKINRIERVDNIGAYVVKYMTKTDADERLIGKKMYQCSKGLKKPEEYAGKQAEYIIEKLLEENIKKAYTCDYKYKLTDGKVSYEEFNTLRKDKTIRNVR